MCDADRELAEAHAQIEGARAAIRLAAERLGPIEPRTMATPRERDMLALAIGTLDGALLVLDARREGPA